MKKAFNIVSAVIFFAVIALFALSTLLLSNKSFDTRGSFTENAEKYVTENFPLFDNWRSMYSSFILGSGQARIGNIYITGNGLIEILTEVNEPLLQNRISAVNRFCETHSSVPFYSLVAPTASGIYSAELPMTATSLDQQKLIDDIYFNMDTSIQALDAYNALFSARDDYIYFRTDSHWTPYGAYTVYSKVIKKMGFSPVRLSTYDMEYADRSFYGDLYSKTHYSGVKPDLINIFRNKNGSFVTNYTAVRDDKTYSSSSLYYTPALDSKSKLNVFLGGGGYDKYTVSTSNADAPRLLVIKGRYADIFVPFLTPHYSEMTLIDIEHLYDGSIEGMVDVDSFDQILLLTDVGEFAN